MSESRHQRVEALFHACLDLPKEARGAWLDFHAAGDPALRAEIEALLTLDSEEARAIGPVVRFDPEPLPERLGPYRLGRVLGEGGFGTVVAAEQESPVRRSVAIKVLKAGMDSRAVLARFEAERHTLARMDHPGIARILDAGATPAGRPFFVMERVDGEPITAFCERHRLGVRERASLMAAVCRAVEHAHQKGVIHRDLKPSNLLVTLTDGKPAPKVIDFGIAKAVAAAGEGTLHTRIGEFLGTPEYVSPEHAESGGADVDTRTDVYALGAVLYRLLTGRPGFDPERLRSAGVTGMARILREEEPPRPSAQAPAEGARDLRGDLDWITLKAMERERENRYTSAAALADDLERYLRDEAVEAGPPSAAYRLRKFARRRRALVAGAAAVLVTVIAGLFATGWQAVRARRAEEAARHQAEIATAVSGFLTRMLGAANPERNPRGADVTVRQIVDQAARELNADAATDPDIESDLRQTLGATYMGLGLYGPAEEQLRRAAALRAREGSARGDEALDSRLALAELDVRRGAYPAAESLLAALGAEAAHPGADRARRIRYLRLRGDNATNLGLAAAADSLLTLAVETAGTGGDSLTLSGAIGDLARVRGRAGRMVEAESLARRALGITRRARRGPHQEVATGIAVLGEILRQQGRFAETESLYREAIAIQQEVLGADHPMLAYSIGNRATALGELGRLDEAERGHRAALDLLRRSLGDDHPEVAIMVGNLATVLQNRGAYGEALVLRQRMLEVSRRLRGAGHPDVGSGLNNLGSLYRLMGRTGEAETAFQQAIAVFRGAFGDAHPLLAVATHNLGKTRLDAGRIPEGEASLREALALGARVFPAGHVNLVIFAASHGRALAALGRRAEAERELLPAYDGIVATFGAGHPRARETAGEIAKLYAAWNRPADAAHWRSR